MSKLKKYSFLLILMVIGASCSNSVQKIQKSGDNEYKRRKALEFYEKGEYVKALPLLEEMITIYKGREKIDELYYKYSMCHFYTGSYLIASFHFKNIHDNYPLSDFAEECLFMTGKSYSRLSPDYKLDQTYSQKAIEALQLFMNTYPESSKVNEGTQLITTLRRKLEVKAFYNAELYFKTSQYKAASTAFRNLLKDFPDTDDAESAELMVLKSDFYYAENSYETKREKGRTLYLKLDRFTEAEETYQNYASKYGGGVHMDEAKKLHENILEKITFYTERKNELESLKKKAPKRS